MGVVAGFGEDSVDKRECGLLELFVGEMLDEVGDGDLPFDQGLFGAAEEQGLQDGQGGLDCACVAAGSVDIRRKLQTEKT